MSDIGYLAALMGGVLALLSPCSAMLLPAFFAYAFQNPRQLLAAPASSTSGWRRFSYPSEPGPPWWPRRSSSTATP